MRALLIVTAFSVAHSFAELPEHATPSPDGKWLVASQCRDTRKSDSCNITLSRRADGKVFFTHRTVPRYIKAVWSRDSSRCVLLDAPDNANSYLWLFRVKGREVATEKLDYEKITAEIETAVPAAHRQEPILSRSGIEKIEWPSSSQLRLHITCNNVPVVVAVDLTKPNSPVIRVLSHNET